MDAPKDKASGLQTADESIRSFLDVLSDCLKRIAGPLGGQQGARSPNSVLARITILHVLKSTGRPLRPKEILDKLKAGMHGPFKKKFELEPPELTRHFGVLTNARFIEPKEQDYAITEAGATYLGSILETCLRIALLTKPTGEIQSDPLVNAYIKNILGVDLRTEKHGLDSSTTVTMASSFSRIRSALRDPTSNREVLPVPDPIWTSIEVDPISASVMRAWEVRRLGFVKQLGFAYIPYPSANHTRYEHALGTYHLVNVLLRSLGKSKVFDDQETKILRIAGLLHDIGHGPFGHTAESLLKWMGLERPEDEHEHYSGLLIRDASSEVNEVLKTHGFSNEDIEIIAEVVEGKETTDQRVTTFKQLVNGTLDLDRIDYVHRDSYYIGQQAARWEWNDLLNNFRFFDWDGIPTLALRRPGVFAAEAFIIRRMTLYSLLYHHPVNRLCQEMVVRAVDLAYEGQTFDPKDFMQLVDSDLTHMLMQKEGLPREILLRVMTGRLYRTVLEKRYDELRDAESIIKLRRLTPRDFKRVEEEAATNLGVHYGELIIDVPEDPVFIERNVFVTDERGESLQQLHKISSLLAGTNAQNLLYDPERWKLRAYVVNSVDPEKAKKVVSNSLISQ